MSKKQKYKVGFDDCAMCSTKLNQENNSYVYGLCTTCIKIKGVARLVRRIELDIKGFYDAYGTLKLF